MKKLKWMVTLAGLSAVASGSAMAHVDAKAWGGLSVTNTHDNAYWFSIGGRADLDETVFSGGYKDKGNNFPSSGNIRRAIVKLAGGVGDYMDYNLSLRFNGSNARFEDAWVGACAKYSNAIDKAHVRVGQFTPPTSMDDWGNYGTTNSNVFLESALATSAFSMPTKVYGVWGDLSAMDMFTLSAAVYQPNQENLTNNYGDAGRNDRVGAAARLTFAPVHQDDKVFHLGLFGRYQSLNKDLNGNAIPNATTTLAGAGFWAAPEARGRNLNTQANLMNNTIVNTGWIRAKSQNVLGAELLGIMGPASVQAEYYQARVQRVPYQTMTTAQQNPRFHGWHIQAAYVLTGEHRVYNFDNGTLHNPKPASKCGAWELAARYSYLDLNNKDIYGGTEHNTTVGVNWFVNDNVRLAANYIRANIKPTNLANKGAQPADGTKRQLDIFGLRVGLTF